MAAARLALTLGCGAMMFALAGAAGPEQAGEGRRAKTVKAVAAPQVVEPRAAAAQADVFGGYVSGYVCLRLRDGAQPAQLADGSWTLRRAAALNDAPAVGQGEVALAIDEARAREVFARHHVTSVARFYPFEFKRPDLARQYGLDRAFVANVDVAAGGDVRALLADLTAPAAGLQQLIEFAQLDNVGSIAGNPNDPSFGQQWDMDNTGQIAGSTVDADIDAPEGWDIHTGSTSTIIAILDTGVQADHPDLSGKVIPGIDTYQMGSADSSDLNGHGTHCAGIAAAKANNGIGVAGTNWNAKILAVRVTSASGSSNQDDVAEGVIWAADNDANVISMSLQFYSGVNVNLQSAVAYAYDSGVLPVAAAGNRPDLGLGHAAWPGRYDKCMSIAGTTNTDARWFDGSSSGSCDGPELDVAAPAKSVFNLWRLSGYNTQTGTSMATPHVAGLAALLMSYNPSLTLPQIENIIRSTAEDVNAATNPGFDNFLGYGRVNIAAALLAAAPDCQGDATGNGTIDVDDLIAVILAWGVCPVPPAVCPADVAPHPVGNGSVDVDDLIAVILRWGASCP